MGLFVGALGACTTPSTQLDSLASYSEQTDVANRTEYSQNIGHESHPLYGKSTDNGHVITAIPPDYLPPKAIRRNVAYRTAYPVGTIVVDTDARRLYHILSNGRAMRYFAGVGAAGFEFSGEGIIMRKAIWPHWTPTPDMLRYDPKTFNPVRGGLAGGPDNPLGARALYLYQNGKDTLYRIHGTPSPWSVGYPSSAGCIRLFNQDVVHLAARVKLGTRMIVLPASDAGK